MNIPTDNLIGFQYSSLGSQHFTSFNPKSNNKNPWTFTYATEEEAALATQKAHNAFQIFQTTSLSNRAAFLRAIAREILALDHLLLSTYCAESGLPVGRAEGERGRTIGQLEGFAKAIEKGQYLEPTIDLAKPDRKPIPKVDIRKINHPIGPIVVFGASNFPLAYSTAGGDTASALACGCPVIVKSHPMHAATGALVANAILKAAQDTNMPDGVFSNLNSPSFELGKQLVMDPLIKGVGFTGSIQGGTALYAMAQSRPEPIPVFAEMGSVNPVVILPEGIDSSEKSISWAKSYAASIALSSGQFCTNPGLIFCIESPQTHTFLNALKDAFSEITPASMLHPNIQKAYTKGKNEVAVHAGLLSATKQAVEPNDGEGAIYQVSASVFSKNPRMHEEVFGPMSLVVICENIKELVTIIKKLDGQLTGTIIGDSLHMDQYHTIIEALKNRVGRIIFNGVPTGVEVCAAMQHGGPFPASTDARFTAVGVMSMRRWLRPISFQNWPDDLLPLALQDANPLKIWRILDGQLSKDTTNE